MYSLKPKIRVLIMSTLLLFLFPILSHAVSVGKMTSITGKVDITSPGEKARIAKQGDEISVGDIIRTKSRSKAELTFVNRNILRMAASSRVELTEYVIGDQKEQCIFKLYRGKVRNIVKLSLGKAFGARENNRYEVHTPTAVVGVRGTDFFTYHVKGISGSTFKEGIGYGYSINRPADFVKIKAGQTMIVTSPDMTPMVRTATEIELRGHERDTSPNNEKGESGNDEGSSLDILTGGADNGTSDRDRLLREGIDNKIPGTDPLKNSIDIPQQVPQHQSDPYHP